MAHAYYHALSSTKKFGGVTEDYLLLHEFMDSTKAHVADARHRMFLHNAWGIFLVAMIFGETITRKSDQKQVPTRPLLEQHVKEDFGTIPTLPKCFDQLERRMLHEMGVEDDTWNHAQHSAKAYGGDPTDYYPIHLFLNQPRNIMPDARFRRVLHNAWGITLAEYAFRVSAHRLPVSIWQIAEDHIIADLGHIPTMEESLTGIQVQPWMHRAARQLSQEFGDEYATSTPADITPEALAAGIYELPTSHIIEGNLSYVS